MTIDCAENLFRGICCIWAMGFFSIQSFNVYIHKHLTKRPNGITTKQAIDFALLGFAIASAVLFQRWMSGAEGIPEGYPNDFKVNFLTNVVNRQDNPEYTKFPFTIFMGIIIIFVWMRVFKTVENTMLAGPTLRILSAMVT